ncbi:MAG: tRNA epoxyqueuosine(34) reductase QueG [Bacteroidales bacterium]|nr:tRNA epoxyqueuosine(34) reductase QueG [Bacteroidales bacterium]
MYNFLLNISRKLGFADFGVAKAEPLTDCIPRYEHYISQGYNAGMSYLERNFDKRMDPCKLYEGAKSVLVFLAPYSAQNPENGIASFAYGLDYHKVLKDRLYQFLAESGIEGRPFVDSAPIVERQWAVRAGLGLIGKNQFLISPELGLRTFIGVILSTVPYEQIDCPDLRFKKSKVPQDCGSCGRCIAACPTGALTEDGILDARKCVSYRTIESKELQSGETAGGSGFFFGCDRCLNACPWNNPQIKGWPEFEQNKGEIEAVSKQEWLSMSQEEFEKRFGDTPLSRPGLEKLKNNINFA